MMPLVAFDLDGTLLEAPPGMDYDDIEAVARMAPIEAAVRRARSLRRLGHPIVVVTGRREELRWMTELQVAVLLGPGVPIHMQAQWRGVSGLVAMKSETLRGQGAALFVGDSVFDARAAEAAGTRFLHATAFAAGEPLPAAA